MNTEFVYAQNSVQGRERKRLSPRFALGSFKFEQGLRDRLFDACGGKDGFGFALGRVLFRHACGVWGPIPATDRSLNGYVLRFPVGPDVQGRWVVSQHSVAGIAVEITTELLTGHTIIRRAAHPTRDHQLGGE